MPDISTDIVRWFVLAQGAFLLGFSVAVMVEAGKFRAPPKHVIAIAASYMILVVALGVEVHERLGNDLSWRTLVAFTAYSFGLYSQFLMYRAYKFATRLRRHEQKAITEGNAIMRQVFERKNTEQRQSEEEERNP